MTNSGMTLSLSLVALLAAVLIGGQSASLAQTKPQSRPQASGARHFRLVIDGVVRGEFQECSGLETPPKRTMSLKRGITRDRSLWDMRKPGGVRPKNVTIIVLDESGKVTARWMLRNGWISKYDAPDFNAKGNDVAIETLEITHEGIERE